MKKLIVMLLALTVMLSAAIVDISRAQKVAENYYDNYAPASAKGNAVQKVLTKEYLGQPTWYVVQFTKGFVIVSAEDNVRPILGYSFTSPIDEDLNNMNNPFVAKFSNYDKQIVHAVREAGLVVKSQQKQWKDIENGVFPATSAKASKGPLLETTWGQGYPFDDQLPYNCPVGCVATAMHQILRFYQGPEQGAGSNDYNDYSGSTTGSHSVNFSLQSYDWSLMQTLNGSVSSQAEIDECSKMAYHLGVSVNMDYETDGSGATMTDAAFAFQNNWGAPTASYNYAGTITDSSLYSATIIANIDADQPMEWAGQDATYGGHAYCLDGYNVDAANGVYQYHFNWGWSGSYDGWFQLNDLTPGVNNFSSSQSFIDDIYVDGLLAQMPPPASCNASVDYAGDVTVTWTVPGTVSPMGTIVDYAIYRDNSLIKTMGGTATLTYVDPSRPQGTDTYFVKAVYENPDGNSLASPSSSVSIVPDPNYPVPVGLSAVGMGDISNQYNRTSVDLAWAKPFVGVVYIYDGFESNTAVQEYPNGFDPLGWESKTSASYPPSSWTTSAGTWAPIGPSFSTDYKIQGDWCMGSIPGVADYQMVFYGTQFNLTGNPNAKLTFWPFAWQGSTLKVVLTTSLTTPNITEIWSQTFAEDFHLTSQIEVDLSSYTGDYYIGFVGDMANGSFFTVDEVNCGYDTWISAGNPSDQPTEYEIYRNNSLLTTVPATSMAGETYADTAYEDGTNQYYVRAVYGSNSSIASNPNSAWMDIAPEPYFLDGTYDEGNDNCDLSWYAPGHYPPHWFAWEFETDDMWYLNYTDDGATVDICRTYFNAMDFGMGYPVYISDISCPFWEETGDEWVSDQFRFAIGYGADQDNPTYLHTSATLTAVGDGSYYDYALPQTYEINEDWFVEVQFINTTSANPSPMMFVHEEGNGIPFNTTWHYDDGTDVGWYAWGYNSPYDSEDMAVYCYGWNNEPTYSKGTINEKDIHTGTVMNSKVVFGDRSALSTISKPVSKGGRVLPDNNTKAITNYQVWRNDVRYDTTMNLTYTDTNPVSSNTYYITAMYSDPVAESDPSNEIVLGPPPVISVPTTIAKSVPFESTDTGSYGIENTGLGDLNYSIAFEYDGNAGTTPGLTIHSNDFTSFPGTGYTQNGWVALTGGAQAEGARDPIYEYLSSGALDLAGYSNIYLDFDQNYAHKAGGYIAVEYSEDGGATWVEIYREAAASTTASQHLALVEAANQIRFVAYLERAGGNATWWIDNILITGDQVTPYTWNTITSATIGTVLPSATNTINYDIDTAGLTDGNSYTGRYIITSNDANSPDSIEVTLTVENTGGPIIPAVPANVVTSIVGTDLQIDWDVSADATGYDVYASDDPYAATPWAFVTSVATNQYTVAADQAKLFYYIVATNATKTATKVIKVNKPVKVVK